MKRHPTEWEKIPAKYISDEWLISKIYKELIQLNKKTQLTREEELNRHFPKKTYRWQKTQMIHLKKGVQHH